MKRVSIFLNLYSPSSYRYGEEKYKRSMLFLNSPDFSLTSVIRRDFEPARGWQEYTRPQAQNNVSLVAIKAPRIPG